MKNFSNNLSNEIAEEGAVDAEKRMLESMLGLVQRRKNKRTTMRLGSVAFITVLGLWLIQTPFDQAPMIKYANELDAPYIEIISNNSSKIGIINTTDNDIQYFFRPEATVQYIDDKDLELVLKGRAFAIVDYGNKRTFHLIDSEG